MLSTFPCCAVRCIKLKSKPVITIIVTYGFFLPFFIFILIRVVVCAKKTQVAFCFLMFIAKRKQKRTDRVLPID